MLVVRGVRASTDILHFSIVDMFCRSRHVAEVVIEGPPRS